MNGILREKVVDSSEVLNKSGSTRLVSGRFSLGVSRNLSDPSPPVGFSQVNGLGIH